MFINQYYSDFYFWYKYHSIVSNFKSLEILFHFIYLKKNLKTYLISTNLLWQTLIILKGINIQKNNIIIF